MKRIGDIYSVSVLQIKSLETQWFQGFFLCFYACFDPLFTLSRFSMALSIRLALSCFICSVT